MSKWIFGLAALLAVGVSASDAQYFSRPNINQFGQPGGVAGFGNPYFSGPNYGPYSGFGYPGLVQPGMAGYQGYAPGVGLAVPGAQNLNVLGSTGVADAVTEDITGHPTRFNSYARYFNNQGGSTSTSTLLTGPSSLQNTLPATNLNRPLTVGVRPPRGRGNTPTQP